MRELLFFRRKTLSSIAGSSGSDAGQIDKVRQTREEYFNRESDLIERHKRQVKKMSKQHQSEVQQISKNHERLLKDIKTRNLEFLSEKEKGHLNDISELRSVQLKQVQKRKIEADQKVRNATRTANIQVENERFSSKNKIDNVRDLFREREAKQQKNFYRQSTQNLKKQRLAIRKNITNLGAAHKKELQIQKELTERQIADLKKQNRELRENSYTRLKSQNLKNSNDRDGLTKNFMIQLKQNELKAIEQRNAMHKGYKDSLKKAQKQFEEVKQRDRENEKVTFQNFKSTIDDRVNNQVKSLENKNTELKNMNVVNQHKTKKSADRQLGIKQDAFEAKVDFFQRQHKASIDQIKENSARDIRSVRKETADVLRHVSRTYRKKMIFHEENSKDAFATIKENMKLQNDQQRLEANKRVNSVREIAKAREFQLIEDFSTKLVSLKNQNEKEKSDLRYRLTQEKEIAIKAVVKQLKELEATSSRNKGITRKRYEGQIATLNQNNRKEKLNRDGHNKRLLTNVQKSNKSDLAAADTRNKERMSQMKDRHDQELKRMSLKHQKQVTTILDTIKNT